MVLGISQVVLDVEDHDRALGFWTGPMGFELVRDAPLPRRAMARSTDARQRGHRRPESAARRTPGRSGRAADIERFFCCDDLPRTYEEQRARGVEFPEPPVRQPFGWWSMFQDSEGNRLAPMPRDATAIDGA
jgi:predicted enzyme related to lactoylglutathione lyase